MASRENAVVTACINMLKLLNVPHMRNNSGMARMIGAGGKPRPVAFGSPGWPDIIGVLPDGRFLGVECKAPAIPGTKIRAGKLSDNQRHVCNELAQTRALVLVVTSAAEMSHALAISGYFRDRFGGGKTELPEAVEGDW